MKNIDQIRAARKEIQAAMLAAKDAALLPEIAQIYKGMDDAYAVLESIHTDVLPRAAKYTGVLKLMKPEMAADFMKVASGAMPVETLVPLASDDDPIVAATVSELMKLADQLHKAADLDRELNKFQLVQPVEVTVTVKPPTMVGEEFREFAEGKIQEAIKEDFRMNARIHQETAAETVPAADKGEQLASPQRNKFERRYDKYRAAQRLEHPEQPDGAMWAAAMKEAKGEIPKSYFPLEIKNIESGRYGLNSAGNLYDAYARKSFAPVLLDGKMRHTLCTTGCGCATYAVDELRKHIVMPVAEAPAPVDNAEKKAEKSDNSEWVWLDFMDGIPQRRYRVYRDGRIWDTARDQFVEDLNFSDPRTKIGGPRVYLSSGSLSDRTEGSHCFKANVYRKTIVFRAFYPSVAKYHAKLQIKFRDGNIQNCSADNLYIAGMDAWLR